MSKGSNHIVQYRTYFFVLLGLLFLTGISVAVTQIELGPLTVFTALFLAVVKSTLVLLIFMHLKFDNSIYKIMIGLVLFIVFIVFIITFLDYSFR